MSSNFFDFCIQLKDIDQATRDQSYFCIPWWLSRKVAQSYKHTEKRANDVDEKLWIWAFPAKGVLKWAFTKKEMMMMQCFSCTRHF